MSVCLFIWNSKINLDIHSIKQYLKIAKNKKLILSATDDNLSELKILFKI